MKTSALGSCGLSSVRVGPAYSVGRVAFNPNMILTRRGEGKEACYKVALSLLLDIHVYNTIELKKKDWELN